MAQLTHVLEASTQEILAGRVAEGLADGGRVGAVVNYETFGFWPSWKEHVRKYSKS